ncbi:Acetyltransferase, including N-acetylase of ribosomal protein [Archaeoglobus sulfaticallidus PM70-1]|uniref:Acetyltransferase, including N-acetylase of ribosomal protein n=1 Tax=Archaeoglobus sulfaticallidus PM70-1 TaxID=387631 RepID=N0BFG2_9EURY|nr:GNAT family N-acetyltransferase [Archaeoglobus sulfaticallidus]AGK61768.1 Acetyltransferase, including N-acetylase of ribosomal protein [Archaeoglobus sulfaticallidus PM70-1]
MFSLEEITIRKASLEDYTEEKYEFIYNWMSQVADYLYFTPKRERMEKDRIRFLASLESNLTVVAVTNDGKVVGQCQLFKSDSPKLSHVAKVGIAVAPSYWRKGIGTALLRKIEEIAKSEGIIKIEAEVIAPNTAALNLFKKNGYHQEGRRLKKFNFKGSLVDEIEFGKFL